MMLLVRMLLFSLATLHVLGRFVPRLAVYQSFIFIFLYPILCTFEEKSR